MRKFVNDPQNVVTEEIQGLTALYPQILRNIEGTGVVTRTDSPVKGKVGLASGGGSGHEPLHAGYVGKGMLDAAVAGAVFTSPPPDQILTAIFAVDGGRGVLLIIKNYSGDIMNFQLAEQLATASGIEVSHVVVNDDVAIKAQENRRGVAGTVLVHKIAGAKAEAGASLEEVKTLAEQAISNIRTMGVALSSCINPAVGKPIFSLGENEMEIGIGIHGEAGVERMEIQTADRVADMLYQRVTDDLGLQKEEEVFALINGMGGTPLMELQIVSRKVCALLSSDKIRIFRALAGNYCTSLEMAGFSLSLLRVDEEMRQMLLAPQLTPSFPNLV
ncbi:MAG: dihydroxyacetone kinase subunit DhaK [Thaumarchaeota archaeon]|nr:dihydroxyacetone kinase subunit DhaK [Nitrososphaerota archaeon]